MSDDPFQLQRFTAAQADVYQEALSEIKAGLKQGHWMWFVFPQIDGLGRSGTARFYSIKSAEEAVAYLNHPVLGWRLIECSEAILGANGKSAEEMLGSPDHLKLWSSMTLFAALRPINPVFAGVIERFFGGQRDAQTINLLSNATPVSPQTADRRRLPTAN